MTNSTRANGIIGATRGVAEQLSFRGSATMPRYSVQSDAGWRTEADETENYTYAIAYKVETRANVSNEGIADCRLPELQR
jgi:hypothetical protein